MSAQEASSMSSQYLSFILRDEHFAVAINKVREVLDVTTLTKVPRMPDFISGVINLRGSVVPVIDLGYRLGMEKVEKTSSCWLWKGFNCAASTGYATTHDRWGGTPVAHVPGNSPMPAREGN